MKENDIRRAIDEYSRETSAHPFKDYGDKVYVRVNDDCPIRECTVRTQYEDRAKESVSRPYRGWDIAPRKYHSLDDVDEWNLNLRIPEGFTDKKSVVDINGSAYVQQCFPCNGTGHTVCYSCHGKGKEVCPRCHGDYLHLRCDRCGGDGRESCPSCNGKGEQYCKKCNGTGRVVENVNVWKTHWDYNLQKEVGGYEWVKKEVPCSACQGRGHWRCNTCKGTGTVTCKHCNGNGVVTCPDCSNGFLICKTCGGNGKLVCRVCDGAGQNEFRYVVNRTLSNETRRTYICDKRVRAFAEEYELPYSEILFSERRKQLGDEMFPEDVRCSSSLAKLVARSEPDSVVILFQEATVRQVMTTYVEYDFDGGSYSGYVCDGVFYPENSPIDEWSSKVVANAEKKIKRGSSATSLKMLDDAELAGGDRKLIGELRAKALKKLGNLQDAGTSVAFWFVILFISPVVFNFYMKLNPVASWAVVTNNPSWRFFGFVPLCQTILFLLFAIILRISFISNSKDNGRNYSSIWTYFAKGFFLYLLASLAGLAVLLLLNYIGLSILTTFILGVIVIIVAFIISIPFLILHWIL